MESFDNPTKEGKSVTAESVAVGRIMANEVVSCCCVQLAIFSKEREMDSRTYADNFMGTCKKRGGGFSPQSVSQIDQDLSIDLMPSYLVRGGLRKVLARNGQTQDDILQATAGLVDSAFCETVTTRVGAPRVSSLCS